MTEPMAAPAEMPGVEEMLRRILAEARVEPEPEASDFAVENIKALFTPILAEKERLADAKARALEYADTQFSRALAAEAALAAAKEASRQAVMAFFDELAARGVDQDIMADAMEALADKSDAAVAEARAAAIRARQD